MRQHGAPFFHSTRGNCCVGLDYVIVGAGLFGGVFARQVAEAGHSVLLVDRRPHIGGNCYSESVDGVEVHKYGPHIFHTANRSVWEYINRFTAFNGYRHKVLTFSRGNVDVSWPWTTLPRTVEKNDR
jgi:UDP-galactopyranose mutase